MPTEIEHKYLVKQNLWRMLVPEKSLEIRQGYLFSSEEKTIRVRTKGAQAYITIKGKKIGNSCPEYEYEIPLAHAEELITQFCSGIIEKTRHYVHHDKHLWEVDEFKGANAGLLLAEIELSSENETYTLPPWLDQDVTNDPRYANANLAKMPYSIW